MKESKSMLGSLYPHRMLEHLARAQSGDYDDEQLQKYFGL